MSNKNKSFTMGFRDLENIFKHRRMPYPKRSAEFIALIAVSCTLFLFLHTKSLNSRLHEMEIKLQPSELSALGLTGGNSISADDSKHDLKGVHGTYQYLKSTGQMNDLTTDDLNNTKKAEMNIIVFNRVPKVGSQTLMELMKRLGRLNGFKVARDIAQSKETVLLGPLQQANLAEEISDLEEPAVFAKHVAYINFTRLDLPTPIYINMIRDPVERIISWYYYVRAPWYFVERKKKFKDIPLPDPKWIKKDFETCVRNGDKECTFIQDSLREGVGDHRRQTLFFCGQSKSKCIPFNSHIAMQKAKETVEKEYAVVGSWEDTNVTLTVLEHYIPLFFKGATTVYYIGKHNLSKINRNFFKPPVSEEIKNIIRQNLTREIEFYQFCKQRLYNQYRALNLKN